jgi:aquaporin Z
LEELLTYCVAQVAGAIAAALVLYMILSGKASGWNGALGQTTWSEYSTLSAFIFETVGTFLFLVCILGVTQRGAPVELAGIAIGLTLAAIHLVGINISGSSVNSFDRTEFGHGVASHNLGMPFRRRPRL